MSLIGSNIQFKYDNQNQYVIKDFSIELKRGEIKGMIAPSGRGKTTCCKILAGYEKPFNGDVLVDNESVFNIKGYNPVQLIFQHPEMSVNPRLKMKEILHEGGVVPEYIIKGLEISDNWLERYPSQLSGGELQRFCIARALLENTKYILADEITTMLDLITQKKIWDFILSEVKKRNLGLLVVSHNEELINAICESKVEF